MNWSTVLGRVAIAGFFLSAVVAYWFLTKVIDNRRGRELTAARILMMPFFLDQQLLTEDGRRYYGRFLGSWCVAAGFWLVAFITTGV